MRERYKIVVSDPWDYENAEGQNVITGQVLKRIGDRGIVFMSDSAVNFEKLTGNVLVLSNRYDYKNTIKKNESLSVNGGLLTIEYDDELDEETLRSNSKFVIIGQLKRLT